MGHFLKFISAIITLTNQIVLSCSCRDRAKESLWMAQSCEVYCNDNRNNKDYNDYLIQQIEVAETCSQVADG